MTKKIIQMLFPLEMVGGLRTALSNFEKGFEDLEFKTYRALISTNVKKLPDLEKMNEKNIYGKLNYIFGFEREEWLKEFKEKISRFDYILFHCPAPHLLKNYTKDNWKIIYKALSNCFNLDNILLRIHDPYFEKYYFWLKDIVEKYKLKIYVTQQKFKDSIYFLTQNKIFQTLAPYEEKLKVKSLNNLVEKKVSNLIIDTNNFKFCKNKDLIFKYNYLKKYKIVEFGDETEFAAKRFKKEWKENDNFKIKIKGWVSFDEMQDYLRRSSFGLDLAAFSNVNNNMDFTILEYVDYGIIPIHHPNCILDKTYELKGIELGKELLYDRYIVEHNKEKLKKCNPKEICKSLLDFYSENRKKKSTTFFD